MSELAIVLLIGSIACLLHLLVGLALGTKLARSPVFLTNVAPIQADPPSEAQRLASMWFDLRLRLSELAICADQFQRLPFELVTQWRSELAQLSEQLRHAMENSQVSQTNERGRPPAPECEVTATHEIITNDQILDLLDNPQFICDSDEPQFLARYKFSAKQPLAPATTIGPLPVDAFRIVQFHDLSVRDIRYFVDDLPTEDKVVIGLGVPKPIKWIAAQVEDSRSAFMYGRVGYLVTARFFASLDKRGPQLLGA